MGAREGAGQRQAVGDKWLVMFRRLGLGFVALVAAIGGCVSGDESVPPSIDTDGAVSQPLGAGSVADASERAYFVRLAGPSAVGALGPHERVSNAAGKAAILRRLAELDKAHASVRPAIEAVGATIIGDFRKVVNAFQVMTTTEGARRLAELPGVVGVERSPVYYPSLSTGLASVQAPQAWDNGGGTALTGQPGSAWGSSTAGSTTSHADFGGSGDPGGLRRTTTPDMIEAGTFPTHARRRRV